MPPRRSEDTDAIAPVRIEVIPRRGLSRVAAGNMHALVEAMRTERDAWQEEAEQLRAQAMRRA